MGFNVCADIETYMPEEIWDIALTKKWLTEKDKLIKDKKASQLFHEGKTIESIIQERNSFERKIIKHKFTDNGKRNLSQYIAQCTDHEITEKEILLEFQTIIESMAEFLSIDQ